MCLAIPARVVSVEGTLAVLDLRGKHVQADAGLVPVRPGDFVLVYGGVIVQTLDQGEAQEQLRLLASTLDECDA